MVALQRSEHDKRSDRVRIIRVDADAVKDLIQKFQEAGPVARQNADHSEYEQIINALVNEIDPLATEWVEERGVRWFSLEHSTQLKDQCLAFIFSRLGLESAKEGFTPEQNTINQIFGKIVSKHTPTPVRRFSN
jgi:hypothetical protein